MLISDNDLKPKGYVEEATKMALSGWVTYPMVIPRPTVKVIQNGETICAIRPQFPAPKVLVALQLSSAKMAAFRWKLPFPLLIGLIPDLKFLFASRMKPICTVAKISPFPWWNEST